MGDEVDTERKVLVGLVHGRNYSVEGIRNREVFNVDISWAIYRWKAGGEASVKHMSPNEVLQA